MSAPLSKTNLTRLSNAGRLSAEAAAGHLESRGQLFRQLAVAHAISSGVISPNSDFVSSDGLGHRSKCAAPWSSRSIQGFVDPAAERIRTPSFDGTVPGIDELGVDRDSQPGFSLAHIVMLIPIILKYNCRMTSLYPFKNMRRARGRGGCVARLSDRLPCLGTRRFPRPADTGVPVVEVAGGKLKIEICADNVVRVVFARDLASFERPTLATAVKRCVDTPYTVTRATGVLTVATAKLTVRVDTATGAITFLDSSGQPILAETAGGGRTLTPAVVQGERVFQVRQQWQPQTGESLYGLGQHQHGLLDIKDTDLELRQYNTEVAIPFLVSSRGYGILWDNTSFTRFGDLGPAVPLPGTTGLYKTGGEPGDVEAQSGSVELERQRDTGRDGRPHVPDVLVG